MSEADDRHLQAQRELAQQVRDQLTAVLNTITLLRSGQVRAWYAMSTAATVSAGQWQAGQLAIDYLSGLVEFDTPPNLEQALGGALMTASDAGAVYGIIRLWRMLDDGFDIAEARQLAGSITGSLAVGDLQAAQRAGLDEGARVAKQAVKWRKVANPAACDWCAAIAGGPTPVRYRQASTVPFHRDDRCGVAAEVVG